MAIEQVKTISELERLPSLLDSYALAVSTGATTGSSTLLEMANYLKTYLQDVTKKIQTINESSEEYPSSIAVKNYVEGYAQALTSLVQNLDNPAANTYPSTQAVKNESDRIINLMDSQLPTRSGYPNYSSPTSVPDNANWEAPNNGVVVLTGLDFSGGNLFISINNHTFTSTYKKAGHGGGAASPWVVRKNDVIKITWNAGYSQHECRFFPFY